MAGLGKRMVMWADPVEHHPDLLRVLPTDIVLVHWHYGEEPAAKFMPSVRAGFHVIGASAISAEGQQPSAINLRNVEDMTALTARPAPRRCLGRITCWWEPFRQLRDTYAFAAAFAGRAMTVGRAPARAAFASSLARDYFGLRGASAARAALGP